MSGRTGPPRPPSLLSLDLSTHETYSIEDLNHQRENASWTDKSMIMRMHTVV